MTDRHRRDDRSGEGRADARRGDVFDQEAVEDDGGLDAPAENGHRNDDGREEYGHQGYDDEYGGHADDGGHDRGYEREYDRGYDDADVNGGGERGYPDEVHPDDDHDRGPGYSALLAGHDSGHHDEHDGSHPVFEEDEHGERHSDARRDPARRRRLAILGGALVVLLLGIVLAFQFVAPIVADMFASKDYDGPGTGKAAVVVHQGDSGRVIAQTLVDAGVVKTTDAFEDALEKQPGDEIQPGSYVLPTQMKASDALSALRSGKARDEVTVTIREGLRAAEIYAELSKATGAPVADYVKAAKNTKEIGLPAAAQGSTEGFLFPATYTFGPKTGAAGQLEELVSQAKARYSAMGVPEKDMRKVITIASIVEAEGRLPQDRPKVAAVIENRLRTGMALQMDSTVAYGVGKRTLTTTDAERRHDNPYNTYLHPGLPKGPINNPGANAVEATLHPAKGDWKYFVTVNPQSGETLFASSLSEHNANVQKFQAWCQANPGKC